MTMPATCPVLPPTFEEAYCVEEVSRWIAAVYQQLTSDASRLRLRRYFKEQLTRGSLPMLEVISASDAGSPEAYWAICDYIAELMDDDAMKMTPDIRSFIRKLTRCPALPVQQHGGDAIDNWLRDVGIAVLVYLTMKSFHLPLSRSAGSKKDLPTAPKVAAAALARHDINLRERTVRNIYRNVGGIAEKLATTVPQIR